MRKTLLTLAVLAGGLIFSGAAASAAPLSQAGAAGIAQPDASVQLVHGWHHHHHGWGGFFIIPGPGYGYGYGPGYGYGACYERCRYYHGPRYCHARCGY